MTALIEHAVVARIDGQHTFMLTLTYDPSDPLAVVLQQVVFRFRFGRQLLSDGMAFPAGDLAAGDVMVQPFGDEILIDLVGVDSCGCPEHVRLSLNADDVSRFLDESFAAVAEGDERIDIDAAIAELLGGVR